MHCLHYKVRTKYIVIICKTYEAQLHMPHKTIVSQRVLLLEQELLIILERLSSSPRFLVGLVLLDH